MMVGFHREDALYRSKQIVGINLIATRLRQISPPSFDEVTTKSYELVSLTG